MSRWTHIVGVLHVDTYAEVDDIKQYIERALKGAPRITGSEGDATIFVNPEPGYCMSTNRDCNRCEYKNTLAEYKGCVTCAAPKNYVCPDGDYQSRAIITIFGDLRDRTKDQTKAEWKAFKKFISKEVCGEGFYIRNWSCKIMDD